MESPAHTGLSAKTADHDVEEAAPITVGGTPRPDWIGSLPTELWLCIIDHLCPHCYPGPVRPRGSVFYVCQKVSLHKSRCNLLATSRACRLLRDLAQNYVFHRFDSGGEETLALFQRTLNERSDLARAVRDIRISSSVDRRSILGRVSNLRSLTYIIEPEWHDAVWADTVPDVPGVAFGDASLEGKLKGLRDLALYPPRGFLVDVPRGRLWLETLMKAAPALRTLACIYFVDCRAIPDGPDMRPRYWLQRTFPHYAGLPENHITSLHLSHSWFRYHSLEQLLQNFKHLRDFQITYTAIARFQLTSDERMVRPVDGRDVITLLEPLKDQLEHLTIGFKGYPTSANGWGAFQPIRSLAGFTALKFLKLDMMSIAPPVFSCDPDVNPKEWLRLHNIFVENTKAYLVNILPSTSLETLWIDDVSNKLTYPMCEFARRASLGEFPRLRHVRLRGRTDDGWGSDMALEQASGPLGLRLIGRYHDLERLVPKNKQATAIVIKGGDHPLLETKARKFFREAGVRFDTVALKWHVQAGEDESARGGWIEVYAQPCVGVCGYEPCNGAEHALWSRVQSKDVYQMFAGAVATVL